MNRIVVPHHENYTPERLNDGVYLRPCGRLESVEKLPEVERVHVGKAGEFVAAHADGLPAFLAVVGEFAHELHYSDHVWSQGHDGP